MATVVDVDLPGVDELISNIGFQPGGRARLFFMNEVIRLSDDYVPFDTGMLKTNVVRSSDGTWFQYNSPYARYQWYGKLMVMPKNGKGAFFSPEYGFWSLPGQPKVLTEQDLNYQGAPKRGAFWVQRMWADYGQDICEATERFINNGQ